MRRRKTVGEIRFEQFLALVNAYDPSQLPEDALEAEDVRAFLDLMKHRDAGCNRFPLMQRVYFTLDDKGKLNQEPIISFGGFRDFGRVQKCFHCSAYFLQERTDQKYCSEKHRNASRQKQWRSNEENRLKMLEQKKTRYRENKPAIAKRRKEIREYKKCPTTS